MQGSGLPLNISLQGDILTRLIIIAFLLPASLIYPFWGAEWLNLIYSARLIISCMYLRLWKSWTDHKPFDFPQIQHPSVGSVVLMKERCSETREKR